MNKSVFIIRQIFVIFLLLIVFPIVSFFAMSYNVTLCFFFVAAICAAFYIVELLLNLSKGKKSLDWLRIEGKVLKVKAKESIIPFGKGLYFVENFYIDYEYGLEKFIGNRLTFGGTRDIRQLVRDYVEGNEVIVFVNPMNHKESVLEPGFKIQRNLLNIFGILISCGLALLLLLEMAKG